MEQELETIIRQHADMVYRLALVQTHRKEDAEDVFQEVFIRLVKHQSKLQSEEHVKYWLIRVTINCCHSLHSSSWKKHETTVEVMPEKASESDLFVDHTVYDTLCTLPDKYRSALHLFYYEELSVNEIAEAQQCSIGTIKSLLSRGRKLLESKLREVGYQND